MKKSLLIASAALLAAGTMYGQRLQNGYVTWPASEKLHTYVSAWNGGNGTIQIDGVDFEDHNFFISRVKPRTRIYNQESQIRTNLRPTTIDGNTVTAGTDKRLIFWVPISNEAKGDQKLNALPDGIFDGEMFSMWSYVDVYGNWNSPFGWTPGNFADICHKNGVAVHGVAGVPNATIPASWSTCFNGLSSLDHTAVAKFLYYHGQDGLGYNSEWTSGSSVVSGLISLHRDLQTFMASRNPIWEVMWYGGTTESGSISFDSGVSGSNYPNLFQSSSIFLNYNWQGRMANSISYAVNTAHRDPFYIYAGMNMQGGEPKRGSNYDQLKDYAYSIGLWGAHSINMLWNGRFANGGSDLAKQKTYQKAIEQWFGNGPRNPAIQLTPTLNRNHRPNDNWAGMSSMMSERSTINHNVANEAFVTFFNIGNGFFFNWKGERQNDHAWHNIGVQDYMPTWRFWFAPTFMQKNVTPGTTSLDAEFIWDDAYMGGSCLKVSGSATQEYLHLFRTAITPAANSKVVIRYKLLNGEADINLVLGSVNNPTVSAGVPVNASILTVANSEATADASYLAGADGWVTKVFTFSTANLKKLDGGVGVIGLEFKNAKNMELLLGEFGWFPGSRAGANEDYIKPSATPGSPVITKTKALAYNPNGADIKVIWEMPNNAAVGDPVYNADVNTSVFRTWAQQEGCEPINTGMTTSWAAINFGIPVDIAAASSRVRVGVSAVSEDFLTESSITWSDYITLPEYEGNDNIAANKSIIKANEEFELSFVDPLHVSAAWTVKNASTGVTVWTGEGRTVTCTGCPEIGAYTVEVTFNGVTKTFANFISISPDASGALPEIYSLAINDANVDENSQAVSININEERTFSYTGRDADGSASRGIEFQGNWVGVNVGEIGIQPKKSFSIAAWVKYPVFNESISNFITIENRETGGWPASNWGFFWSRINKDGMFLADQIDSAWGMRCDGQPNGMRIFYKYADAKIEAGAWTHVALVFEYDEANDNDGLRMFFYLNGVLQKVAVYLHCNKGTAEGILGSEAGAWTHIERLQGISDVYGEDTYTPQFMSKGTDLSSNDWIAFGGSASNVSSLEGSIDDFQVWYKAMTQEDVIAAMTGLDADNLPAEVLGFWDFESEVGANHAIAGRAGANATNQTPKAYIWSPVATGPEGANAQNRVDPVFSAGTPQIAGVNYPIVTKPTWSAGRGATVTGDGTGASGSATISWARPGDYTVDLTLANGHGSASRTYPVIKVVDPAGIEGVVTDESGVVTYTESNTIFVEFAEDGVYDIEVYNVGGMLVGSKTAEVVAGQNAQIGIGADGVYLVKVTKGGKLLRTVKMLVK